MGTRAYGTGALGQALGEVIRERLRFPEYELAEAVGVSRYTVGRWLNGERSMSVDHLAAIATALGLRPSELVQAAEQKLLGGWFLPPNP